MKDWKKSVVLPTATVAAAVESLNATGSRIVLVADSDMKLAGIVTDGDLRRGLLKGAGMTDPVATVMSRGTATAKPSDSNAHLAALMTERGFLHLPVVDEAGRLVGLKLVTEVMSTPSRQNWVVLMAGGLGMRLRPLTENTPKPMLEVGGKPVLETILERFLACGFYNFFISVNYRGEAIEDYFGSGTRHGANIHYLHEKEPLGTAGALSLLPELPGLPCLVSNADVLTTLNYSGFLDFHHLNAAVATMGVREYSMQVPYGVIQTQGNRLMSIEEKPVRKDFVNGGIYALSPLALELMYGEVGRGVYLNMPELFTLLMDKGLTTAAYPINEYWLDIGRPEDLARANAEYSEVFG